MFASLLSAAALLMAGLGPGTAGADHATVTAVEGSAYGCFGSVSLFGGPAMERAPLPTAEIPATGGVDTETVAECRIQYGPGIIFTSGPITVASEGTTGPAGTVTSTATVGPVNVSGVEVFTASGLASTCTANEGGATGSTTIANGILRISEGDPNVEGDDVNVPIPTNPDPNTSIDGVIEGVGDSFRAVFNEQIVDPVTGTLTVNAYHLYLVGPTAIGDVIVGQSVCGVTTSLIDQEPTIPTVPDDTTPTVPDDTTPTVPDDTTPTVPDDTTPTVPDEATTTTTDASAVTATSAPRVSSGGVLPRTGSGSSSLAQLGLLLFAGGLLFILLGRRQRIMDGRHASGRGDQHGQG